MIPRLPDPNAATVARCAMLLSDMTADNASNSVQMIQVALYQGLLRNGWDALSAAEFSIRFLEAIAKQLHEIADAAATTH